MENKKCYKQNTDLECNIQAVQEKTDDENNFLKLFIFYYSIFNS